MPASACVAAIVERGVVRAGADDQRRAALGAHARARVDDRALLVGVERGASPVVPSATIPAAPSARYSPHSARSPRRRLRRRANGVMSGTQTPRRSRSLAMRQSVVGRALSSVGGSCPEPLPDRPGPDRRVRHRACSRGCSASAARSSRPPRSACSARRRSRRSARRCRRSCRRRSPARYRYNREHLIRGRIVLITAAVRRAGVGGRRRAARRRRCPATATG